jgi:hypothetical protein
MQLCVKNFAWLTGLACFQNDGSGSVSKDGAADTVERVEDGGKGVGADDDYSPCHACPERGCGDG